MNFLQILSKRKTKKRATRMLAEAVPDYSGVEVIVSPETCCSAAQDLASKRFLVSEMPILPLARCDVDCCRCSYQRFDDRRRKSRRAADVGFDLTSHLQDILRRAPLQPGRRESDQV